VAESGGLQEGGIAQINYKNRVDEKTYNHINRRDIVGVL
jgi:hypothetical protein